MDLLKINVMKLYIKSTFLRIFSSQCQPRLTVQTVLKYSIQSTNGTKSIYIQIIIAFILVDSVTSWNTPQILGHPIIKG